MFSELGVEYQETNHVVLGELGVKYQVANHVMLCELGVKYQVTNHGTLSESGCTVVVLHRVHRPRSRNGWPLVKLWVSPFCGSCPRPGRCDPLST